MASCELCVIAAMSTSSLLCMITNPLVGRRVALIALLVLPRLVRLWMLMLLVTMFMLPLIIKCNILSVAYTPAVACCR